MKKYKKNKDTDSTDITDYRKRKNKKKKFAIQCRFRKLVPKKDNGKWFVVSDHEWDEWGGWSKYETEKDRSKAFQNLQSKKHEWIEYRIPEEGD